MVMANRKKIITGTLVIVVLSIFFFWWYDKELDWKNINAWTLSFGNNVVLVEVANTLELKKQGLSGRDSIDDKKGMLFVFDRPETPSFWMKDMKFPIDIIFFDKDWNTVDIKENFPPESYPETYTSKEKSKYVVEVNAGFASRNNWQIGNQVKFEAY